MTTERKRGFAVMHPDLQREIASLGGITAHKMGKANEWNSETAKLASAKSLEVRLARKRERDAILKQGG